MAIRGTQVIPLWPFALFGVPRHPERGAEPNGEPAPLVYARRGEVHLQYTPLRGAAIAHSVSDDAATERFLALFRVEHKHPAHRNKGFSVPGFEQTFRQFAERLVGQVAERETLRRVLDATPSGVLWLEGPAGSGKSYLLAHLAHKLLTTPSSDTLVLAYRFRADDPRW